MSTFPPKIFLIGAMGSGKSYWGRNLALHLKYPCLDLDKGIEKAEQRSITDIFGLSGEAYFRMAEQRALHHHLKAYPKFVMSCGGGTPCFFDNMDVMLQAGVVIWLKPPMQVLIDRLKTGKEKRPLIKDAANEAEIGQRLEDLLQQRAPFYERAHFIVTDTQPDIPLFLKLLTHA